MAGILDALGLGATTAGAVSDVYAAYAQARLQALQVDAQKAANQGQAAIARNNAWFADVQASDALKRGAIEAGKTQISGAALKSTQRARMAANNISLTGGSALRVLTDTDYLTHLDAMTNIENAQRESWAYRAQEMDEMVRAELLDSSIVPIAPSAGNAALGSLLGGAGSVARYWRGMV